MCLPCATHRPQMVMARVLSRMLLSRIHRHQILRTAMAAFLTHWTSGLPVGVPLLAQLRQQVLLLRA